MSHDAIVSGLKRDSVIEPNYTKKRCRPRWSGWRGLTVVFAAVLAALFGQSATKAADSFEVETRVKAAFIYNFARFVDWPPRSSLGPVRIGILGQGDLASPLEEVIRGKSVSGRPIVVTVLGSVNEADCCEILLIERSESKRFREIAQTLAGKPVLTVCDDENGSKDGVMIAFQLVEESVRFHINQEAAERAGLRISSQLLKVAISGPGKRQ
jgi:hypothetical protein